MMAAMVSYGTWNPEDSFSAHWDNDDYAWCVYEDGP